MFKARWRSDKSKIKALFKLRFEVVQVPLSGWESLVVSLVPADSGKPSVRSARGVVVDGTCTWERAVFETVKLSRDPKTGKFIDKVYRFLVSENESAKGRVLGEATFDFAGYAESIKPSVVSLQLKGAPNSAAVLHITVQRVPNDANGKEDEENETVQQGRISTSQLSNGDAAEAEHSSNGNNVTAEGVPLNGHAELRFHSTRAMVMRIEHAEIITKSRSFDASSSVCTESALEKTAPSDAQSRNTNFEKGSHSILSPPQNLDSLKKTTSYSSDVIIANGDRWGSNTEWSLSSAPDESLDGSTNSSEDTGLRDRAQEADTVEKLRNDIVNLARQVEVSELELQALRKQVVKERKQGEDLSKELCLLREDRDSIKRKCELLKASHYDIGKGKLNGLQDAEDLKSTLEETRSELNHEKSLNATISLQLQKMQESNSELIFAVKDLEELLEQKSGGNFCLRCQRKPTEMLIKMDLDKGFPSTRNLNGLSYTEQENAIETARSNSEHEEDEELQVLAKERNDHVLALSLDQKIADLKAEIELYKKDHDDIEMQMEQLALDYEILKQEHHDISTKYEQSQLREQLRMQYECSAHISIINDLEAQVENLEKELERQETMFEEDLASITKAKIEQEQRAIQAEAALQSCKWNSVAAAGRLQEEFRKLSSQMSTTFVANEKLAMKAITDASQLRLQKNHLEELLAKAGEEITLVKNQFRLQLRELLDQVDLKTSDADDLRLKLKNKNEEMEIQRQIQLATEKALSEEISYMKSEIEKLEREKCELSRQIIGELKMMGEIETFKKLAEERENLLLERTKERDALLEQRDCIRNEWKKSREELENFEKSIMDKELTIRNLKSDLESFKAQYNGLAKSFLEGEMEKENLREQVRYFKKNSLNSSIKEDSSPDIMEEERIGIVDVLRLEGERKSPKDLFASTTTVSYQTELSREAELLKEKNQSMEEELKEMQGRYSELSLKFAEVEGERQQLVMRVRALKSISRS